MITVYEVDGSTRLFLPSSAWGHSVREKLVALGHTVSYYKDQAFDPDLRGHTELKHRDELLESTGL